MSILRRVQRLRCPFSLIPKTFYFSHLSTYAWYTLAAVPSLPRTRRGGKPPLPWQTDKAHRRPFVQHSADRDKRLHDPSLPSARPKQSALLYVTASVISVTPNRTDSRDPQLPGAPPNHRGRRPYDTRCCGHTITTPTPGKVCCGRATRVDGQHDHVCWFCAHWYHGRRVCAPELCLCALKIVTVQRQTVTCPPFATSAIP